MFHMIVRIGAICIDYSFSTVCQDQKPYVDLSMTFNFAISGSTMFNSFNIGWVMLTKLQRSWNSISVSKSSFSVHADWISCLWYVIFFKLVGGRTWQSFAWQCLWMLKLICIFLSLYQFAQRNMKDIVFWLVCQCLLHLLSHGSVIFYCIYMYMCVSPESQARLRIPAILKHLIKCHFNCIYVHL